MNDMDRWGEDRGTPPIRPRNRRRLGPIIMTALVLLGLAILFPAARFVYVVCTSDWQLMPSSYAKVSGRVRYNGLPVADGKVSFIGPEGTEPGTGDIQKDGTYIVQAVPIGDVQVCVLDRGMPRLIIQPTPAHGISTGWSLTRDMCDSTSLVVASVTGAAACDPRIGGYVALYDLMAANEEPKPLPKKYKNIDTSGLRFKIKRGTNEIYIDLTD